MIAEEKELFRPIEYDPWPSQLRFHNSPARFKGFSGSVGSGKSLALVHEALKLSVINGGLPGLIGAPTFSMLRDSTQKAFFEVLEQNSIPYQFLKAENKLVLTDLGSEIWFRSLDNPERLRGTNLAWYAVDELTYCQPDAWTRLMGRLRHASASHLCGYGCWTPKGFNWVYDLFLGPKKQADYDLIRGVPYENTKVGPGYYESLARSYDPRFFEQEVLGEYLPISGNRVYYAFDRNTNVKPLEIMPNQPVCWSLDFNVGLMCSVIGQIEDRSTRVDMLTGKTNRLCNVVDEIVLPNSNIEEVCNEFKRRMEPHTRRGHLQVMLYGDASAGNRTFAGPTTWNLLREHFRNDSRFNIISKVGIANPPVQARVNAVNGLLLNRVGEHRLLIDPRCKTLITDLEQVSWKQDASGNQAADLDKTNMLLTHCSDSMGYLVDSEFGIRQRGEVRSGSLF